MAKTIIDYTLATDKVVNPDGAFPSPVVNFKPGSKPGANPLGNYTTSVDFSGGAKIQRSLFVLNTRPLPPGSIFGATNKLDRAAFCLRVLFKINGAVNDRQNLVESTDYPFAFYLSPGKTAGSIQLVAAVLVANTGWPVASTQFETEVQPARWLVADLVYDRDTLAIFLNGKWAAGAAFSDGKLVAPPGESLYIGTWIDGSKWPFKGEMAAVKLFEGIPDDLQKQMDAFRRSEAWHISLKYHKCWLAGINLGSKTAGRTLSMANGTWNQPFENGHIMYRDGMPAAHEMHGAIWQLYSKLPANQKAELGCLMSDEIKAAKPGSRKNLFSGGGIYWSPATGAHLVRGFMCHAYEQLGESAHVIGLPVGSDSSGEVRNFEGGSMYRPPYRRDAFEVHGVILEKYLQKGGHGAWGFPTTHESPVKKGNNEVGRFSKFEKAAAYWSPATGAHLLSGPILERYIELGGPTGVLGFPTSSVEFLLVSGSPDLNYYATFQNGTLRLRGAEVFDCLPFQINIRRINFGQHDSGPGGESDPYFTIHLFENDKNVGSRNFPENGQAYYSGQNIIQFAGPLPYQFVPNDPNKRLTMFILMNEHDDGFENMDILNPNKRQDEDLGYYRHELTVVDGWGWMHGQGQFVGVGGPGYDEGSINDPFFPDQSHIPEQFRLKWRLKTKIQGIDFNIWRLPPEGFKPASQWWGVKNQGSTQPVTYNQYASAIDVDPHTEWWQAWKWMDMIWYEAAVKNITKGGNCMGMSLEAENLACRKSYAFSYPLHQYTSWAHIENEINIKHIYQLGCDSIAHFLGELFQGRSYDPKYVFEQTRMLFETKGERPMICLAENWDFGGAQHVVFPIAWDTSRKPWRMKVLDPNAPFQQDGKHVKEILVDPDKNCFETTFTHNNGTYKGGPWSGGHLYYIPWTSVNHIQGNPLTDVGVTLLGFLLAVICLGDAEVVSLTDVNGNDLNGANGKQGTPQNLRDKFFPLRPLSGPGQGADAVFFGNAAQAKDPGNQFVLHCKGTSTGNFKLAAKRPLSAWCFEGAIGKGELTTLKAQDQVGANPLLNLTTGKDRTVALTIAQNLGIGGDRLKITMDKIPVQKGKELQVNATPGLHSLQLLTAGQAVETTIRVESVIGGKTTLQTFKTKLEGGAHFDIKSLLASGKLAGGNIDTLGGAATAWRLLDAV